MILKFRISHTFHEISHTLSSHDKHKLLFFFIQQYFSPQPTDIYMQGSIQERFIKPYSPHYLLRIQTVALQWTDHCTLVNSSVYSSERFYPLEWNEWNVAFIIWKERQSRIRLQSIHLWNSTANDTNGHKKERIIPLHLKESPLMGFFFSSSFIYLLPKNYSFTNT